MGKYVCELGNISQIEIFRTDMSTYRSRLLSRTPFAFQYLDKDRINIVDANSPVRNCLSILMVFMSTRSVLPTLAKANPKCLGVNLFISICSLSSRVRPSMFSSGHTVERDRSISATSVQSMLTAWSLGGGDIFADCLRLSVGAELLLLGSSALIFLVFLGGDVRKDISSLRRTRDFSDGGLTVVDPFFVFGVDFVATSVERIEELLLRERDFDPSVVLLLRDRE